MTASLARICRFPVKGMSAEDLDSVQLTAGQTLPGDRRFAIARDSATLDPAEPGWVPKSHFVTLVRTARLARLTTRYDAETGELAIYRGKRRVAHADITDPTGRSVVDQFLAAFLDDDVMRMPRLIDAGDTALTDAAEPWISVINLASVRDLARVTGMPVDAVRFRGNLLLDGLPPWVEWDWPGHAIDIGAARLNVIEPIARCAAVDVNPETGARDTNLPKLLRRGYGHVCLGVYASVAAGGTIATGDPVTVPL